MKSPYSRRKPKGWLKITKKLIEKHPLSTDELVDIVLESWEEILLLEIGKNQYRIGKDIFPKPQVMGFFLHELVPLKLENLHPGKWRREKSARDKDAIYIPNGLYSIEIKTSSSATRIFGNRSYAQKTTSDKKSKSGYYLAINFEKFKKEVDQPRILKVRFGWLDHDDWMGQKAATGQQARLSLEVETYKLMQLYAVE